MMKKFLYEILDKFLTKAEKRNEIKHQKRMKKLISATIGDNKIHQNSCATLSISNKSDLEKKVNIEKIEKIVYSSIKEPKRLFAYIKNANTQVFKNRFADKILRLIHEDEGFIFPKKGLKALYLNLIFNHKLSFKTKEMFVVRSFDVNIYAFMYQFYNWYCFRMGLSGYDFETQEMFKHVFEICETPLINKLSIEEIYNLKNAICRDKEAIDFVLNFTKKYSTSKEALEKMKNGEKIRV